jgi:hypothetical protein
MASHDFAKHVLDDAPLLYFRFNEGHLSVEATDASGKGNHGRYSPSGSARLETVAAADAAVRFSGGGITVKTTSTLNPSRWARC